MDKPKRITADQRHEMILESAKKVFAEKGLAGARTKDIAAECGINEALLYKHFPSKEALFRESVLRLYKELEEKWLSEAAAQPTGLDALQALVRAQLILLTENTSIGGNLLHAIASATHDQEAKELAKDWFVEHSRFMMDLVERGIKDGSLKGDLIPERATIFIRGVVWMYMIKAILGLSENQETMLNYVKDTIKQRIAQE